MLNNEELRSRFNKGLYEHQEGHFSDAQKIYKCLVCILPANASFLGLLGTLMTQTGGYHQSVDYLKWALRLDPFHAASRSNLGNAFSALGLNQASIKQHKNALIIQPAFEEGFRNLGITLAQGTTLLEASLHPEEAVKSHTRSFLLNQNPSEAHLNFANGFSGLSFHEEALKHYRYAIALNPTLDKAYIACGNALNELKRYEIALAILAKAIALLPDHAEPRILSGYAYLALEQIQEAISNFGVAAIFKPNLASTFIYLGCSLLRIRRFGESAGFFHRAYACDCEHVDVTSPILYCAAKMFDWEKIAYWLQLSEDALQSNKSIGSPFPLLCVTDNPNLHQKAADAFSMWQSFDRQHTSKGLRNPPADKIKVGYFTSDLREHPVFKNMMPLLKHHDRSKFQIFAFNFSPETDTCAIALFDRIFDISSMSDKAAAELARSQNLDIAVDLNGHTEFSRTMLFAHGVAPIQVNFLGYPGTMGGNAHDYIITDKFVVPPECEAHYSESVAHLPDFFMPYDFSMGVRLYKHEGRRSHYGLPEKRFVFCSFNELHKITSSTFGSWINILLSVTDSVLWIAPRGGISEPQLIDSFTSRGIEPHRIILADRIADHCEHLNRLRLADLMLDTFPYNSHTTACDAISVGLPILTISGKSFASRVSGSLLTCMGLEDLIVENHASYESLAIVLAQDRQRYASIRQRVKDGVGRLPSSVDYARNLESLYADWACSQAEAGSTRSPSFRPQGIAESEETQVGPSLSLRPAP